MLLSGCWTVSSSRGSIDLHSKQRSPLLCSTVCDENTLFPFVTKLACQFHSSFVHVSIWQWKTDQGIVHFILSVAWISFILRWCHFQVMWDGYWWVMVYIIVSCFIWLQMLFLCWNRCQRERLKMHLFCNGFGKFVKSLGVGKSLSPEGSSKSLSNVRTKKM